MGKTNYLEYMPEIFKEIIEEKNELIQSYKNDGLPKNAGYYYHLLIVAFQDMAIGEMVLNQDHVKCKQNFYLAGKIQEIIYEKYDKGLNDISSDYVTTYRYTRLLMALISDNEDLINSLAKLFGGRTKEEKEDFDLHIAIGYSLKYILLGQIESAKEYIVKLEKIVSKKSMKNYSGYAQVFNGILNNDPVQVNEGLKYMVECHKKLKAEYEETPQELLSIPVLALAKLAIRKGLAVQVDDALVPAILLEKHQIHYPEVDFVD